MAMGNMPVCTAFSKLPVNELVFNGTVRGGTRTRVQAGGPLPDEVSSSVARFHQQGLVKARVQRVRPKEAKDHLQTQEGGPAIGVPSFQDRWPQPLQ